MSSNDFTDNGDSDAYMTGVEDLGKEPNSLTKRENRIFIIIVTISGAITVLALACIVTYGLVMLPNPRDQRTEKDIEVRVHNTSVAYEITLTHSAAEFIPTETGTASPSKTPTATIVEPTLKNPTPTATKTVDLSTSTPIKVPTSTPGLPDTYKLHSGESPYCIALRFNVNYKELLRLSGLNTGNDFSPGTVLDIPQSGRNFLDERTLMDHPTSYTIATGDSIFSIACLFGDVDPINIAIANGLTEPYELTTGESLYIP